MSGQFTKTGRFCARALLAGGILLSPALAAAPMAQAHSVPSAPAATKVVITDRDDCWRWNRCDRDRDDCWQWNRCDRDRDDWRFHHRDCDDWRWHRGWCDRDDFHPWWWQPWFPWGFGFNGHFGSS